MTLPHRAESGPTPGGSRPYPVASDLTAREVGRHHGGETGGSGIGHDDAGKIVDALKASADQEFNIAERLGSKARQSLALAAGVFVVAQTVAFGNFSANMLSTHEKHVTLWLAVASVVGLALAAIFTLKADATYESRDLPLERLEDDLNAAYDGDHEVIGRLGTYYLGVVRSRRKANHSRQIWYRWTRGAVLLSLAMTTSELIYSLVSRTS